jgi:hypothetical protein
LRYFFLPALLLFQLFTYAQIDPHKLDSLRRSIDSSVRSVRAWQDSFRWKQDSVNRMGKFKESDSTKLSEDKARGGEKKITYTIVFIGVVFFIVLILFVRSRKRPST